MSSWLSVFYSVTPFGGSCLASRALHGFADSPVALFRHPLRGFVSRVAGLPTGSRTHPWLYSVTPFGGYTLYRFQSYTPSTNQPSLRKS